MAGNYPESWAHYLICPTQNRRQGRSQELQGITLLNTVGKIFTAILNTRLSEWAETYGILPEEQYGFRPNTECIFILNTLIIIEKTKIDNSTLDLKKAFDNVECGLNCTQLA